jgi:RNA polymerase sigma-70 factor (ECF subfamily)
VTGTSKPTEPDRQAQQLEELFARHHVALGRFIVQLIRSRHLADDLLQETFLAAWRSRADLDHVRDPRAWLYGIARNRVLMYLRGWRRGIAAYERLRERSESSAAAAESALAVRDALERTLSPEERAVIVLFHLHGFQADEIAELSGRTHAAVRKQLERARRKLAASGAFESPEESDG